MNANADKTIETQNESWGFFGTLRMNSEYTITEEQAAKLFDATARKLMAEFGLTADFAREYLDSRDGRHLADAMMQSDYTLGMLPIWTYKSIRSFRKASR